MYVKILENNLWFDGIWNILLYVLCIKVIYVYVGVGIC